MAFPTWAIPGLTAWGGNLLNPGTQYAGYTGAPGAFSAMMQGRSTMNGTTPATSTAPTPDYASVLAQGQKAYDPALISKLFASVYGQMGRSQGGAVANAQRTAAQHGASQSLLNPGAFVMGAGQQARAPYADALANLGVQESQAQMGAQQNLTNLMLQIEKAKQGDRDAQDELALRRQQLALQERQLNEMLNAQQPGTLDWLGLGLDIYGAGKDFKWW